MALKFHFVLIAPVFLFLLSVVEARGQDPLRFKEEIRDLTARQDSIWDPERETVVFTGSSSIRFWEDLQQTFPEVQILNTGFGGSQASDLLYYLDTLVLRYRPVKVFIYEGDNDLAEGKRPGQVLKTQKEIIDTIREQRPGTELVLIAAKPSISRWQLRRKYRRYNRRLARLAKGETYLSFADVWSPMLQEDRKLNRTLFISDGLHMNETGYEIWREVMRPLLTNPINTAIK